MGSPSGRRFRSPLRWRRYRDPAQPSRVHREFPAAPMRDRDIHDASSAGGRRIASGSRYPHRGDDRSGPIPTIIRRLFAFRSKTTRSKITRGRPMFLNAGRFDAVSLQHEFGIFGGAAGGHIMALLSRLTMPIVTTLHTVLATPTDSAAGRFRTDHRRIVESRRHVEKRPGSAAHRLSGARRKRSNSFRTEFRTTLSSSPIRQRSCWALPARPSF